VLPQDPRLGEYEAEQRGAAVRLDTPAERADFLDGLPFPVPPVVQEQAAGAPTPPPIVETDTDQR
jgi:hypothetical protein